MNAGSVQGQRERKSFLLEPYMCTELSPSTATPFWLLDLPAEAPFCYQQLGPMFIQGPSSAPPVAPMTLRISLLAVFVFHRQLLIAEHRETVDDES